MLVITLNRPEAGNSLNAETGRGLVEAFSRVDSDDSIRAVVLTGAGDKIFCGGMDLKAFTAGEDMNIVSDGVFMIPNCEKPVIAAINGAAVAGGFEMMMNCDMVVAADHAKFGIPEVKRSLIASGGGMRLPLRIPLAIALELGLTGDSIDAHRAYDLGLVNRVVPAGEVRATAIALAERVSENGPLAVKVTKQLMRRQLPPEDREADQILIRPVFASADAQEGALAFAEKRKPQWQGR